MRLSYSQFAQRLVESGLLTRDDLIAFDTSLPEKERAQDGDQLARVLVRHRRLTAFQVEMIYSGKEKSLVLGNYVLLDKLGQGGMGAVYKAEHKRMQRLVALKVVTPDVVQTEEALKRFQREVQAAARLEHQNIVTAFDADNAGGTHFLVMQFVEGRDLSSEVKEHGPLAVDRAIDCVLQAASGLEYVHSRGVVHRDIKPSNLILGADGVLKILDMGLARVEDPLNVGKEGTLTASGALMGTVDYMSPEQALDTKQADARSDIYSLGCTFHYLLTGRAPYRADTVMKRLLAHREEPIPRLIPVNQAPSRMVDQRTIQSIFERMVAKRAQDRYQSMTELIRDLRACQSGSFIQKGRSVSAPSEDDRLANFLSGLGTTFDPDQPATGPESAGARIAIRTDDGSGSASGARRTLAASSGASDTDIGSRSHPSYRRRPKTSLWSRMAAAEWMKFLKTPFGLVSAAAVTMLLVLMLSLMLLRSPPTGYLVLNVSQPDIAGAEVQVNGQKRLTIRSIGDTEPLGIHGGAGTSHELRVTRSGFQPFVTSFVINAGGTTRLAVRLQPIIRPDDPAERDGTRTLDWPSSDN